MKRISVIAAMLPALVVSLCITASAKPAAPAKAFVNRIEGMVWAPGRRPVADVYVELQNEMYMSLSRIRTTSSGHFEFTVGGAGNFYVHVLANGTQFMDKTEPVEIVQVTQGSSDEAHVDIYLEVDRRKVNTVDGPAETVYAQNVPDRARSLYETAQKDIAAGRPEGMAELDQALAIFPDYFAALNLAGTQYVQRKEYEKALPYLIKAIDINQRSYSSYYGLAYAAYQLKHFPEATEAARAATVLAPNSVSAQLLYGTLLRLTSNYPLSEKALLAAEKLSKGTPLPDVHMQLAMLYNHTKRNKEAIAELQLFLKEAPNAPNKKEIQDLIAKLQKEQS